MGASVGGASAGGASAGGASGAGSDASGRGRGRPSVVDAQAVAAAAFQIWSVEGYSTTGWKELAEATGISARTLMRHYGTRDRIAWSAVEAANERLRAEIAAVEGSRAGGAGAGAAVAGGERVAAAVRRVVVASVSHDAQVHRGVTAWLGLIASEPELVATGAAANRAWTALLADFLARRLPDASPEVCRALAAAIEAATFSALTAWAESGAHGDPADVVGETLRWIAIAD